MGCKRESMWTQDMSLAVRAMCGSRAISKEVWPLNVGRSAVRHPDGRTRRRGEIGREMCPGGPREQHSLTRHKCLTLTKKFQYYSYYGPASQSSSTSAFGSSLRCGTRSKSSSTTRETTLKINAIFSRKCCSWYRLIRLHQKQAHND